MRRAINLVLLALLISAAFGSARSTLAAERNFPETDQIVGGRLLDFWNGNGGLPVFGLPISDQRSERTDVGRFAVQHFERGRLELHPEIAAPYDVLLGRLGDDLLRRQGRDWRNEPSQGNPLGGACLRFDETQREVCGPFLDYWRSHGLSDPRLNAYQRSLALFGLPLTGVKSERNTSGDQVLTQWFERARFEYHPNNPNPYKVLLGRLGAENYAPESPNGEPTRYKNVTVPELGRTLSIPVGFEIQLIAENLRRPRFMAQDADGTLYVAEQDAGEVTRWRDTNGDGKLEKQQTFAAGLPIVSSLAFTPDGLVAATETQLVLLRPGSDGIARKQVLAELPSGSRDLYGHRTRTVILGADNKLYVSIGSSCDLCVEQDPLRGTVTRYNRDGSQPEVVARGLRNSVGIAFRPGTPELWGVDNGRNGLGEQQPPEELNKIVTGGDYGWPYCHGDRQPSPEFNDPSRCAGTLPPAWTMTAHTAPLGLQFYDGLSLPPAYQGDAIIARHGAAASEVARISGYDLLRIRFKNGRPVAQETLVGGWLVDNTWWGRPAGVLVDRDGSLIISEDGTGRLYRLRYTGAS
ncbi:MAG TPA: PQQ-dependent sugar dehydrogenase [Herpetosiphonaceae bacterium]